MQGDIFVSSMPIKELLEGMNEVPDEIKNIGISELQKLNIAEKQNIKNSKIIRVKKAYPAYFESYKYIKKIRDYIDTIENLYCIGRNGQHKYNNMDHSILSGFLYPLLL